MVRVNALIIALMVCSTVLLGSDDFELSAAISRSKIYQNEIMTLTLTVAGADKDIYKNIIKPNLSKTFTTLSTSQSSSFSYINGIANRKRKYTYNLRPKKPGIFIIDPFSVTYKGKKYSTKPLRVVIRQGKTSKQTQKTQQRTTQVRQTKRPQKVPQQIKSIFIETHISTNNIYLGESIDYSVKFYRRVSLWSSISINQEDMQGVWQNAFQVAPERVVRKNGQRYYELELVKKKIRPLNVGVLSIPPLTARFVVDPFSGEYQLISEIITINANELPSPIPSSFTGAIGAYDMTVSSPIINEESSAIQIQVMIQGTGNIAAISPPVIQDTTEYRVLSAPKTKEELAINIQTFDYVIIPKVTGELIIPPIEFSFFSKERVDYIILKSQSITLNATLDTLSPSKSAFNAQEDIQFLRRNTMIDHIVSVLNRPKMIGLSTILNAAFLCLFFIKLIKSRQFFSPNSQQKNRKKIIRHIRALSEGTSLNEMEKVLVDVLTYFTEYEHPGINPKDVEICLVKAELSNPLVKGTMQWIKNTQLLKYSKEKLTHSNHSNSESLKRILNHIISEKEKK